uniref:AP2-like ethylene-responsive transcription factor ANT n=1 Tax=Cajanus cajan TaxID=3821 RepID=A0A151SC46_CAJCA|nr:AP2-like ethylene-responsive transcription factor ANT [Cajanus cajan]
MCSSLPITPLKSNPSLYGVEALSRSQAQAMHLSLDSMLCNQLSWNGLNNPSNLNHVQQNISQQQLSYYSTLRNHDVILEGSKHQLSNIAEDEISGLKSWYSRDFPTSHAQESRIVPVEHNGGESGSIESMAYGDLHSLNLSVSSTSQSSCVTSSYAHTDTKKRGLEMMDQNQKQIVHRKSIDTFGQRTSQYRGVTRHRWTGRYEAHLWDNSCKKEGQGRKGRQVYLGGYDVEEKAARAYDMAALKYWGPSSHINFPLENYQKELEEMKNMTRQEYVAHLRRKSSGFSRGASIYRGVTSRHHQHGRWQARIGRVAGNKDLYLGTFSTQEEAAEAYDIAAIKFRGVNAVTNFDITRYDVEKIMASNNLLSSEQAKRNKEMEDETRNEAIVNQKPSTYEQTEESVLMQKNKTSMPMLFGMPSTVSKLLTNTPTSNVDSWDLSSNHRPALSLPQMPIFAAWTDA